MMTALSLFAILAGLTGGFESRHAADAARNPSDLHFRLDTADHRRSFRVGERIPLTLAFSSSTPAKYKLDAATYDRSGRLRSEEFVMDQPVADPYIDYFGAGVLGGFVGGIRTIPALDDNPVNIAVELNQWFRFDRAGRYRFYLKSHRLKRESTPEETGQSVVDFAAVSNIVEIEILEADADWVANKLAAIRSTLDPPGAEAAQGHKTEEKLQAWRELDYLGTTEAVRTAFEIARKAQSYPYTLLLFAARDRKQALAIFDAYLADPEVAIGAWDIKLRAAFRWIEADNPKPLPMFVWQFPDEAGWAELRRTAGNRQSRFTSFAHAEAVRLIPVVAAKNAEEREESAHAIASLAPNEAKAARLVPPEDYGMTREQLIAGFTGFTEERQLALLTGKWDLVRGPEMVPVLVQVLAKATPNRRAQPAFPLNVWGAETGIAIAALQRLAQLSPKEIVRVIEADIASGSPRFAGYAVRELPAQVLAGVDDALLAQLNTSYEAAMPLVAKFASARLLERVGELAGERTSPCAVDQDHAAYAVRVAPEENGEGRRILHRALADRAHCGFFRSVLNHVAAVAWNSAIQSEAIAALDDAEPEVVQSAARALATHGGPEVEAAIWKRLEKWSAVWSGRSAELKTHPITSTGPNQERNIESALSSAIITAQAWLFDEPRQRRLAALCVDDDCRQSLAGARIAGPKSIEIVNGGWAYPASFRVDGYSSATMDGLKRKLLQYPAGTRFRFPTDSSGPDSGFSPGQRREFFQELAAFLAEHSMSVEPHIE